MKKLIFATSILLCMLANAVVVVPNSIAKSYDEETEKYGKTTELNVGVGLYDKDYVATFQYVTGLNEILADSSYLVLGANNKGISAGLESEYYLWSAFVGVYSTAEVKLRNWIDYAVELNVVGYLGYQIDYGSWVVQPYLYGNAFRWKEYGFGTKVFHKEFVPAYLFATWKRSQYNLGLGFLY